MMKKIISVLLCIVMLLSLSLSCVSADAAKTDPGIYYSDKNAPVLYGACEITIPTGTDFSVNDARFRVLATDFEDSDLTQSIVSSGTVDGNTAGDYSVHYSVTDSHGNESTLSVPVHVVDGAEKISVKRIVYTLPSTWNTDLCGFYRGSRSDRQILGITLPAGQSFEIRTLSAGSDLAVSCFANDSKTESTVTLRNDGEWMTVKNTVSGIDYPSVPLIKTLIMDKGTPIGTTGMIEVRFEPSVPELNYYHLGDDEQAFRDKWDAEKNSYGILDCSAAMFVLPYDDLKYSVGYYKNGTGFDSLDEFLNYFISFVAKMDEYVGLELDPEDPLDQNVRTRYTVKANASGGGSAYYGLDHVGIHSTSMKAIFAYGWGTLHEFAHGYQGGFGKAPDGLLSEVSNNILGHYIQLDKSIYKASGDWLGSYVSKEGDFNAARDEKGIRTDSYSARLYFVCRLLDCYEGPETYAKMFRYYRANAAAGNTKTTFDVYAETIALEYGVNIIPYLNAWDISVSDKTSDMITQMELPALSILADTVNSDTRELIMNGEGIKEKYQPVTNDVYMKYGVNGSLTVNVIIDDISAVRGGKAMLRGENGVVASAAVSGEELKFTNVPVGSYTLYMPVSTQHSSKNVFVSVTEQGSSTDFEYTEIKPAADAQKLMVQGYRGTYGFTMQFDPDYTQAVVTLSGADMRSSHPYVKVYDDMGELVAEENSEMYSGQYFDYTKPQYTMDVGVGYVIEVYHVDAKTRVMVYSSASNERITALDSPENGTVKYVITKNGLKLSTQSDKDAEEINYASVKAQAQKTLDAYAESVTDSELNNKYVNLVGKAAVFAAYNSLREEDRTPYTELIEALKKGGSPTVYAEAEVRVPYGRKLNPYSLIKIYDNEDGVIFPDSSSVKITEWPDTAKLGTSIAAYTVCDSDGNTASCTVLVTIYEVEHHIVTQPAVKATCTSHGFTEGSYCSICGEVFSAQEELPMAEHNDSDGDGHCDSCGKELGSSGSSFLGGFWAWFLSFIRKIFGFLPFC